ncbi:MAG: nitrate reductase [bacterium]|nr:nitrate reductase [bacterium]
MITTIYALAFYFATILLVVGIAYRIFEYAKVPAPLNIATTPAPTTVSGVWLRMFCEVALFESLFKSNKWIWIFGYLFHAGLLLVLIRHIRYFVDPRHVPDFIWLGIAYIQPIGKYAGFAMVFGLAGLAIRRIVVNRVRYISSPSDHLMLLLLIMIGVSGFMMQYVDRTDIVSVKNFFLSLAYLNMFDWQPLPDSLPLMVHLTLVLILMIIFPYSKLLHAPGIFFSPTRNQVDNPREKRRLAPWAKALESGSDKK